jgi:hypothetical protein
MSSEDHAARIARLARRGAGREAPRRYPRTPRHTESDRSSGRSGMRPRCGRRRIARFRALAFAQTGVALLPVVADARQNAMAGDDVSIPGE